MTDEVAAGPAPDRQQGCCIFCKAIVGLRKGSRLMLNHTQWVSGYFERCPGSGCYATPIERKI